jgi:hypothetical protein
MRSGIEGHLGMLGSPENTIRSVILHLEAGTEAKETLSRRREHLPTRVKWSRSKVTRVGSAYR